MTAWSYFFCKSAVSLSAYGCVIKSHLNFSPFNHIFLRWAICFLYSHMVDLTVQQFKRIYGAE